MTAAAPTVLTPLGYTIVAIFLAAMLVVGFWTKKKIKEPDDFYVAGRKLNPWLLAATLTATNVNLYSFVGQAGVAYHTGASIIWHTWTGNMALVLAAFFVLPMMRRLLIRTIPEMLEMRYSYSVRALASIFGFFRLLMWTAIVLYAAVLPITASIGISKEYTWLVILVLGGITVIFTTFGGMWSVAITDAIQLVLMSIGLVILFIVSMARVGWLEGLTTRLPAGHLDTIVQTGEVNWVFVLAIFLLGLQWASTDQGLLQRDFGARSNRGLAKGMVYSGIMTTIMALLWVGNGLAARILHPGVEEADRAVPTLLVYAGLPQLAFALIIVGFLAAQMSTASSNINAVVTLFCSDIYQAVVNKKASGQAVVRLARVMTVVCGIIMMLLAYFVIAKTEGLVKSYLTMISMIDMPLFIVGVVYAFLWKRANTAGAIGGYLAGVIAGVVSYFGFGTGTSYTAFISGGVALLVCPILSLLTSPPDPAKVKNVFAARQPSREEIDSGRPFYIWPISAGGRWSMAVLFLGLAGFLFGTITGAWAYTHASLIATVGMVVFFIGGLLRLRFD